MTQERILVVDDEPGMLDLVGMYLRREGFEVDTALDGASALHKFRERSPALIILDLMLPEIDGLEVCRQVRRESGVPILMLTAREEEADRVTGLELGADDYVVKPFSPRELVARVKAILRRMSQVELSRLKEPAPVWTWRNVQVDPNRRELLVDGRPVELRPKEFDLLWGLVENAGILLSRDELLTLVWGYDFLGDTRTIDVHVGNLRRRLQAAGARGLTIQTRRGAGYMLEKD